ncbi:hypothetical protein ABIA35_002092 [Catenulispora sp. MAP12-49]|uniref:hypothetical protein n=1 Tax=Catenulispora sp. MAP12-49 TaxID=3156302 RepID=UPI003511EEF3
MTLAAALAAGPVAASADTAPGPVTINCYHCVIIWGGSGTGGGTDGTEPPGVGLPAPVDRFVIQTRFIQGDLIRVSQSGDVGDFFPYPPFLGPNYNVALDRIPTSAVYRTSNDDGRVTITTDRDRLTCTATGTLSCSRPYSFNSDPIEIDQR